MTKVSNFPTGFANGMTLRNVPVLENFAGNVFWVDSGAGSNGYKGTFDRPFATLAYAFSSDKLTANNGDIVMIKPGHTETITAAAGIVMDIAGVTVIGHGSGSSRPTFNFTTAVGADIDIDAANITLVNLLFTGGIDALTGVIDVNAASFTMLDCETRDVTGQMTDCIVADANADYMLLDGWVHRGAAGDGGDSAVTIAGADDWTIRNFKIYGNFDQGAIENTAAAARCYIHDGFIWTEGAEDLCVALHASTTAQVGPNLYGILQDDAANITQAFAGAAAYFMQPIAMVNAAGESSLNTNIQASTDT